MADDRSAHPSVGSSQAMSVEDGRSWDDDGVTPRDPHDEDTGLRRGSGGGRGLHDRDHGVDSGYSSFHHLRTPAQRRGREDARDDPFHA